MAANSTDHSTEFATYTETPLNKSDGWMGWLATLGVVFGLSCACAMCLSALLGMSVFTINRRVATAVAPRNTTATTRAGQSTFIAAVTATAQANLYAIATDQAEWPSVINSTFDLNIHDWPTGNHDDDYGSLSRKVIDGKYQWQIAALKGVHWRGWPDTPSTSDFHATVEGQLVSGPKSATYGIIFRQGQGDSFYYFAVRETGEFAFLLKYQGQWQTLIGWTYSSAIRPDSANTITVIAENSLFTFYINNRYIAQFTDKSIASGKVGLAVDLDNAGDNATFEFDNFELRAPQLLPSPTPTTTPVATRSDTATPSPTPEPTLVLENLGLIAFYSDRDLHLIRSDGADHTRLTNDAFDTDSFPTWSPDGQYLAFTRREAQGDSSQDEIYVINADGTNMKRITYFTSDDFDPAWSPDGKRIAFVSDRMDGQLDIYVMDADGSNVTRLTTSPDDDFAPTWSPDSKQIAFIADDGVYGEVYVINADGSGQVRLTRDYSNNASPAWSPDGTKIAYASDRDSNFEIYMINVDGTGRTRLTTHPTKDIDPAWSPDGKYIAFVSSRVGNPEIYVMRADGSSPTRITNDPANTLGPAWQP